MSQPLNTQQQLSLVNCDSYAERLSDTSLDNQSRLRLVNDLRESIESFQDDDQQRLITTLAPRFFAILTEEQPAFISNSPIQKLRNTVLEIIQRLPQNDTLKGLMPDLMKALMHVLREDNEDNGCLALKIMVDLHKAYKAALEDWVQPFFDIVQEMYRNMEQAVKDVFDESAASTPVMPQPTLPPPGSPAQSDSGEPSTRVLQKSLYSFKVLTECPIIIALLFQLYRKYVNANVPVFVPLIIHCLTLLPAQQRQELADADAAGVVYVGISANVRNRAALTDFIMLQVKTVSFIAYILRSFVPILKPYQQQIADAVVVLMRSCPPDAAATRKELLVATRHIWYTDFRHAFVKHVDILLNEDVLVGSGVTAKETLRPIAHSVLVDLIHHVRADLSIAQLSRAIHMYSRNLHDPNFAPNIQTMCAKLLLNIVDCLAGLDDKREARGLLLRILRTFASKFTSLRMAFPVVLEHHRRKKTQPPQSQKASEGTPLLSDTDGYLDLGYAQPIRTYIRAFEGSPDVVKDIRFLFKNMVQGLKAILNALRLCNPPPPQGKSPEAWNTVARGFSREDVDVLICTLRDGLGCFDYWIIDSMNQEGGTTNVNEKISPNIIGSKEEKEVFEAFASTFTLIEPPVFQDVFSSQIDFIFEQILKNISVLALPQYFLASTIVSPTFAGLMLRFLVDRLEKLGDSDPLYASVMLRLFKLLFMSVTLFPEKNEAVLRPQIGNIIMTSMKLSTKAKESLNYFLLLRALFRSIGGGRFEMLYQEVLPLLQVLLEGLNGLLATAHQPHLRELFVELCLTVPVRLSVLLPYLSYLMKPLVLALEAGPELVSQGLRTLELCVDNLTQDFLEPIMRPVLKDLMAALRKHLKPLPYNQTHSHAAVRILGKLGGRNRRYVKDPVDLLHIINREKQLEVSLPFHGAEPSTIALDNILDLSGRILDDSGSSLHFKEQAFIFAKACLPLLLDVDDGTDDYAQRLHGLAQQFLGRVKQEEKPGSVDMEGVKQSEVEKAEAANEDVHPFIDPPLITGDKRESHEKAVTRAIAAIFIASTEGALREQAWPLVEHLCRHFAMLSIAETVEAQKATKPDNAKGLLATGRSSSVNGFLEAVVEVITSESQDRRHLAEKAIQLFYDTCVVVLGGKEAADELPVMHTIASRFCSCCYQQEWFHRTGGCLGIAIFSSQLHMGTKWMLSHQLEFVKALLYVLKDRSPDMAMGSVEDATQTLSHVLKVCNRPEGEEGTSLRQAKFHSLISLLISELSDSSGAVRETIQSALQLLADLTGSEVTELLSPVKQTLLQRIFAKPLRALPFAMQIGHIDAITYCLSLRPPLLVFGDELMRLIQEALALADAEDQALVSKTSHVKNANSLISLRVVCLKLLSAAMACADFQAPRQANTRSRIVSVFFKSLYSKSPEVVDTAFKGLQQILNQQGKLPKEQLQAGLRPILVNLSDHKRLNVAGLEGLARLLELLTNYFKVEIGKKLLDHLRQWGTPTMLAEVSGKPLTEIEDIKVMVAILDIFPLLPATANVFMDDMIKEILSLEGHLRRTISSPFRPPLIKFLNRYPAEAVTLFFDNLHQAPYGELLIDLLASTEASVFRLEVMKSVDALVAKSIGYPEEGTDATARHVRGVLIVGELCRWQPDWLAQNKVILENVAQLWKVHRAQPINWSDTTHPPGQFTQYIVEIYISYLKAEPDDIGALFEIMEVFEQEDVIDTGLIRQYLFDDVIMRYGPQHKRSILERYLEIFDDVSKSQSRKARILRLLVTPMLRASLEKGEAAEVLDTNIINTIHKKIWLPLHSETGIALNLHDSFKVELLQFTSLLVQYVPRETRKDVIKFAWNNIKLEDVICKQAAYVLLARWIEEYETPARIVVQIYIALLRAHQSDTPQGRVLVRQALDILFPVLPKRIGINVSGEAQSSLPLYVRWARKIIIEDGHSFPQLVTIYQLLARYPDLFYDWKHLFVPGVVKSLMKLAFSTHATPESRLLTVDLCDLLLQWDRRHLGMETGEDPMDWEPYGDGNVGEKRKSVASSGPVTPKRHASAEPDAMDVDKPVVSAPVKEEAEPKESIISSEDHATVLSYLIRIASSLTDSIQKKGTSFRVVSLVRECLKVWPDVEVNLVNFERAVTLEVAENHMNQISNAVQILAIVTEFKSEEWIISNIAYIHKCVDRWVKTDNVRISKMLTPVISRLFDAIDVMRDEEPSEALSTFTKMIESKIQTGLKEVTSASAAASNPPTANNSPSHIYCVLSLISSVQARSEHVYLTDLMKLLAKLVKDHQDQPLGQATPPPDSPSRLLVMLLGLLNPRVSQMGEHRRIFLQSLVQLMDFSADTELLRTILNMVRHWVLGSAESFPTIKEKSNLLVKMMMSFDIRGDQKLLEEYLDLVAIIYSTSSFARSELTVRLEQAFLMGTKNENPSIRRRFADIFHQSIGKSVYIRLNYILGVQNWDHLASYFWLRQALDLLLGSVLTTDHLHTCAPGYRTASITALDASEDNMAIESTTTSDERFPAVMEHHREFLRDLQSLTLETLVDSLRQLLYSDDNVTYAMWVDIFPLCWGLLNPRERHDVHKVIIPLLAKDYHIKQVDMRPNVIQALLEGICQCEAAIQPRLPPQLVRYLGKTYDAWYIAVELLQQSIVDTRFAGVLAAKEDEKIRESTIDALCEIFWSLSEADYFYGLWRRRSLFAETNAAISYEQGGMWAQAQRLYEAAQAKARTGVLPFTESEYRLWEDHWVYSAERLQQWDLLTDLSKQEANAELFLECAWRLSDWTSERESLQTALESMQDSPRRKVFQSFSLLLRYQEGPERQAEFHKLCDEGVQSSLKRWFILPKQGLNAHIPLLHTFQQFVELHEGAQIQQILNTTTVVNIQDKQQELKGIFTTWRDRLPNMWDDITLWSDIVAWRQHVFQIVNKAYLPLIPQLNVQHNGNGVRDNPSSVAFRGYHETAWTINRFAHVARKHQLIDVCNDSLSKIYTLPNIEIHEAFFKLREQAKSYFVNATDYATGLDVINNTNLLYFNPQQKAEFFALKGIFFAKLNLHDDAEKAFSSSIQLETTLAKGWAAFAQYNDRMFKERPTEIKYGAGAMNCYLQAAGIYQNARSRKFLARILWLLSLDDNENTIANAFDEYKGDVPIWYWITFIPQLLAALSNKEASQAKEILKKIAKQYPQALYFQLRTARDDYLISKKQAASTTSAGAPRQPDQPPQTPTNTEPQGPQQGDAASAQATNGTSAVTQRRYTPWEHLEEVNAVVKTAFPLLALSMETMLDQIMQRLKPTTDEDIYRLIVALLNDGVQMFLQQLSRDAGDQGGALSPATEVNLLRFAESMYPNHIKYKAAFEQDFIKSKPNLAQLVERFREWRDKLEILLDSRPRRQHLEHFSHWLVEFEYQKFEDIEVPGQYFLMKDNNKDFVRIDRFEPEVDLIRGYLACHRRFTIRGHDGTFHPFSVQHPAARHCRREERIIQLFRILNSVMERRRESRRRNLSFHLPIIVPLAPTVRLVQDDPSYITLQEIWEDYCAQKGQHKDDPIMFYINRMRDVYASEEFAKRGKLDKVEMLNLKAELLEDIASKFMPDNILTKFITKSLASYGELWTMRKHFTQSLAAVTFMTHVMSVGQRTPHKFHISRRSGSIWASDLLPSLSTTTYLFSNGEPVPFRFTPNIQTFLTPIGVEGVFASSLQAIGRALTEPDYELEDYLSIFVRDELVTWQNIARKPPLQEAQLREFVTQNVDLVLKRTHGIACRAERERGIERCEPANQTILDLISNAVNPHKLCQMDVSYMARL
ncbi:histone acetyltransferase TRA1 [Spizellomyces punctatus DAOM BR117]|uniref:Non-specific serine/threonine protein kinase n=1 Tax=Spizellomyces punctatus (strain DAOM BR117) TaxID=645134 RepID=A0A0L0HAR4_SPIPD|nr:histone acetyltransferase TRA1 [Spizellomyces punctatus DAOM BR117]KNC98645.1 hypothetical protein SPPG_06326 [Spizellomyces punctatus DAOM BR117]|eukprot:XP_016606685.1 hypothetical protein SPPG_06326 [Spizellomyces punctatus DAOM BR117]